MTEKHNCAHEWGTQYTRNSIEIYCPLCRNIMLWVEAKRRINAFDDLLEALEQAKGAVEWMADATDSDPEDHEMLEIVNKAIAKARGESDEAQN